MLKDRRIVLGVTGGIAAYKAAELVRELVRRGAKVRVVMTDHACKFVTPLTFETLSGNPVATDLFWAPGEFEIGHIALAEFAELVVIAPATANIIGKMAAGLADDLLTTVLLATEAPVLICPAMNAKMYANPVVKENLARLVFRGHAVLEPGYGELACRVEGQGRLAEPLGDRGGDRVDSDAEGPSGRAHSRDGRSDAGTLRSGAVHQQPLLRKDGVCAGRDGETAGRGGDAGQRSDRASRAAGRRLRPGPDGRRDAGCRPGPSGGGHGRDQGRRGGRLPAGGLRTGEDQEEGRAPDRSSGTESRTSSPRSRAGRATGSWSDSRWNRIICSNTPGKSSWKRGWISSWPTT